MKSFPFHRKDLKELLASSAQKIAHPRPANSPGHNVMAVDTREGTDSREGANAKLVWGARSDVGLVREHFWCNPRSLPCAMAWVDTKQGK